MLVRRQVGDFSGDFSDRLRRRAEYPHRRCPGGFFQVARQDDTGRKRRRLEVARVAARSLHLLDMLGTASVERDGLRVVGERDGERGAEAARAENRNVRSGRCVCHAERGSEEIIRTSGALGATALPRFVDPHPLAWLERLDLGFVARPQPGDVGAVRVHDAQCHHQADAEEQQVHRRIVERE